MIVLTPIQLYTRIALGALASFCAGVALFSVLAVAIIIPARNAGNALIVEAHNQRR